MAISSFPSALGGTSGGGRGREWVAWAVAILARESARSADTPLFRLDCPEFPGVDLYLKDESCHPSGSLKHRLAHALLLHAICNGNIGPDTVLVEASSGSTAISVAWFARALALRFIAVVPASTAPAKIAAIREAGGEVRLAGEGEDICSAARRAVGDAPHGYCLDQFRNAERATDWRGCNNIAESLFGQMRDKPHPVPAWIVVGAGTGGTSATIGRFIRLRPELAGVRLCLADPEGSAFGRALQAGTADAGGQASPVVEGIGRPRVEPSFMPRLVDRVTIVPDAWSVAASRWLERRCGRRFGPSTGTGLIAALGLARGMAAAGEQGSVVMLGCDRGDRYAATIYDDGWLAERGIAVPDVDEWLRAEAAAHRVDSG